MSRLLEVRCELCGSWSWCGRQCKMSPDAVLQCLANHRVETANEIAEMADLSQKATKAELAVSKVEARKAYMRDMMRKRRLEAKRQARDTTTKS
jgi:hypothetical protein